MAEGGEDRRVSRTKRRLEAALLELMEEREYGGITIRDLTERADVGRSTFYSHFGSKEDLLFDGFERWVAGMDTGEEDGGPGPSPGFRFSLPLLRRVGEQERFFRATLGRDGDGSLRRRVAALLAERVRRELGVDGGSARDDDDPVASARAHAVVGAFLELAGWWLDAGRGMTAEAVDWIFQETVAGR